MQARNARARALGYANYYERRVAEGKARGYTRSQARGHPAVREPSITARRRMLDAVAGAVSISAMVHNPTGPPKLRKFEVDVIDPRGRSQTFRFDVRAKDEIRKLLKDAEDRDVDVQGTP